MMSMRRIVALLLLVQLAGALAIAWALVRYAGWTPALALAGGVAAALLVRAVIGANNFRVSARSASATPTAHQIAPARALRMFGEEYAATMLNSSWLMLHGRAHSRIYPDSRAVPVLLVHGYGCNSGYWRPVVRELDRKGISHATVDLEPLIADIDSYVAQIDQAVQALCAASGATQVAIVGHSMGGLVARAYLRVHGVGRIERVFTLGTPHHGTVLANLGLGANAAQMARKSGDAPSQWLQQLAASEDAALRARITSIYSHHDNIVSPQTSSVLPGARNIDVGGVGHVAMASNRMILACLMHEIDMLPTR